MKKAKSIVGIIMGSDSDLGVMSEACTLLEDFGVPYEITVASAHRSPNIAHAYATSAITRGLKVIIAAAGGAAHLAGVAASLTTLPVIGVPIKAKTLDGLDSLLSTVQMPPGIPVATVGINSAHNAGILAVQILATSDKTLQKKLNEFKKKLESGVKTKAKKMSEIGYKNYLQK
ncbi:MAG: 5-(carboxyamino)imidazole ribonucleotide mutase [Patescibacteria group bacterium]|jgi:5-(carboxyamino)imidazole ribonucleotide mutase|nr:5-(carboxyamino)imidazole ribonucleotide mutase [Patescibacteria group bacterium]